MGIMLARMTPTTRLPQRSASPLAALLSRFSAAALNLVYQTQVGVAVEQRVPALGDGAPQLAGSVDKSCVARERRPAED